MKTDTKCSDLYLHFLVKNPGHILVKCETLNPGKRVSQKAFNQTKHIHSAHFLTLIRYPNYIDQGQINFTDVIGKFSDQYRVTV